MANVVVRDFDGKIIRGSLYIYELEMVGRPDICKKMEWTDPLKIGRILHGTFEGWKIRRLYELRDSSGIIYHCEWSQYENQAILDNCIPNTVSHAVTRLSELGELELVADLLHQQRDQLRGSVKYAL